VDAGVRLPNVDRQGEVPAPRRFFTLLVTAFAALGPVLAALGIYGVISYSVVRQTREQASAWHWVRWRAGFRPV
jgi:hypothetical protein